MIEYSTFELPNGLRVVHHYAGHTPMTAFNLLYNVGSRDESPGLTGMAHLFEHLMFGGSLNIPRFDTAIETAGGWNNAWTSNDFTNFYDVLPTVNAETAFWLESDRMLSLAFTPESLEVQRSVVIEEFKQTCLNQPYGTLMHRLRELLYTTHPYRWPTIGMEIAHIERVTMADVKEFFYSHYAPNNAVLAVTGSLTLDRTRELAEKWFGPVDRREVKPRTYAPEAPMTHDRRLIVRDNVPSALLVKAFPMPGYGQPGYVECDLISDLLSNGRSARFTQNLVLKHPVFTSAEASIAGSEEPGFLMFVAMLSQADEESVALAGRLMTDEALRLCNPGDVSDYELRRAVTRSESGTVYRQLSYVTKARDLAAAVMHGEDINSLYDAYRAVTPADIAATAARILTGHSVTLAYLPA